ncbi:carbohydrate-binding protein [Microbispora sp. ATCC PTA-5024]|uniref:carbohydrate-binding protein n=1 Tax=Microbispora sp. ATCC PTA-5024 TaxID=316330 RepID=UPI001E322A4C|nr:carbohydrate-binding protein [Microbispora sp. ATCC PTA-5024]
MRTSAGAVRVGPPRRTAAVARPRPALGAAGTAYATGAKVTYGGSACECLQAHTAIAEWKPPDVAAPWMRV